MRQPQRKEKSGGDHQLPLQCEHANRKGLDLGGESEKNRFSQFRHYLGIS